MAEERRAAHVSAASDLSRWDHAAWLQQRLGEARQQLAEAVDLVESLIAYSHLQEKVRLRDDLSEYIEAEKLIARADALRGES